MSNNVPVAISFKPLSCNNLPFQRLFSLKPFSNRLTCSILKSVKSKPIQIFEITKKFRKVLIQISVIAIYLSFRNETTKSPFQPKSKKLYIKEMSDNFGKPHYKNNIFSLN